MEENPVILIGIHLFYDHYFISLTKSTQKKKRMVLKNEEKWPIPTTKEVKKQEEKVNTQEHTEDFPIIIIDHGEEEHNDDNQLNFNIIISRVEDNEDNYKNNLMNPLGNSKDFFRSISKSKSCSSIEEPSIKINKLDEDSESKSSDSAEHAEDSIKNKTIDEIYENYKKFNQKKTEKQIKHTDVNKLKSILISKGKYNSSKNILNTLFKSDK